MNSAEARRLLQEENERLRNCFTEVVESCKRHNCRLVARSIISTKQTPRGVVNDIQSMVDIEPIITFSEDKQKDATPIVTPTGVDNDANLRCTMQQRAEGENYYEAEANMDDYTDSDLGTD